MSDCGCEPTGTDTPAQRRVLWIALVLNAVMFVVEGGGGLLFHSVALLSDGLDMLSDAAVYALALVAIGRSALFKASAARFSGWALLLLGIGMLAEVVRRAFAGAAPEGIGMIGIAAAALGGTDPEVLCVGPAEVRRAKLSDLLPAAFGPASLD